MRKLKGRLKKYLKNKIVADIFLLGSSTKDNINFRDIDIIVLFKEKNYKEIEDILYNLKKDINIEKLHIEPLVVEDMFNEPIFSSLIHEGISIRHNKNISELIGYKPFLLFTFSLKGLDNISKVRFAQALYGKNKKNSKTGILQQEGGMSIGKGAFLIPVNKEHLFRDIMSNFNVKFKAIKTFIKD